MDLVYFFITLVGKACVFLIAVGGLNLAFNTINKLDDVKSLRAKNPAYRALRGSLVIAQIITSATLAFVPWGFKSGDWTDFWVWEIGGNVLAIVVLLGVRFLILEPFFLRNTNNLEAMIGGNMSVAVAEGATLIGTGIIMSAIYSGHAKVLADGIWSTLIYTGVCVGLLIGWILWQTNTKKYTIDGVGNQSLAEGITEGDLLSGVRAGGTVLFFSFAMLGAVKGDFIGWGESIKAFAITAPLCLLLAWAMNIALHAGLRRWESTSTEVTKNQVIVVTAVSSMALCVLTLLAAGIVSGAMATIG